MRHSRPALARLALVGMVLTMGTAALPSPPVSAAATPARIVSTAPSITETLFALGLGDRVIAVSQFCRYPPQVLALPKVGTFLKPDLERILTLRPDMVVINERSGDVASRLAALNVPFVAVPNGTLSAVTSAMLQIGRAAGIEAHARDVASGIERRLDGIRRLPALNPRPKVLLIMGRSPEALTGLVAVGRDSYLNDLIAIAGGVNVLDAPGVPPYPRISLETLLSLDPDVIVDMVDMSATESDRASRTDASRALWQRLQTIPAVRHGRVYAADTDALLVPGPRVVDAAEWLAGLIHEPARP